LRKFGTVVPSIVTAAIAVTPCAARTGAPEGSPAMAVVAIMTVVLLIGIRESARLNTVFVAVKLVIVLTFISVGVWYFSPPTG
jgi:APA family basic amino acid/polyamine antiporter